MSDDGGLQWWAELGQHEVEEFEQWLDSIEPGIEQAVEEFEKAMTQPVNGSEKEIENEGVL